MPGIVHELFRQHVYTLITMAATLEGLGLPVPAEFLFLAAAGQIARGQATLVGVIVAAVLGNMLGSLVAFALAYIGGRTLMERVVGLVGIKATALNRVEQFFTHYGSATVFLSRFIGLIRAATIYTAGAARMAPWRFALYLLAATVIWNTGWAWLALTFGRQLPFLLGKGMAFLASWGVGILAAVLVTRLLLRWYQGRQKVLR